MTPSPGEFVLEECRERGWSRRDLTKKSGLSEAVLNQLVWGILSLDETVAEALAGAFGTSAALWLNLEKRYRRGAAHDAG